MHDQSYFSRLTVSESLIVLSSCSAIINLVWWSASNPTSAEANKTLTSFIANNSCGKTYRSEAHTAKWSALTAWYPMNGFSDPTSLTKKGKYCSEVKTCRIATAASRSPGEGLPDSALSSG